MLDSLHSLESIVLSVESKVETVTCYVDPYCPFAWITSRWLREVARTRPVDAVLSQISLSAVNEGRELEPWYRDFNDNAWGPARVAAAVTEAAGPEGFCAFYESYGALRHVERVRDDAAAIARALTQSRLPPALAAAAEETSRDDHLRALTRAALEPVAADVGTPLLRIGDRVVYGPVLNAIPRGERAGELFDSVRTLLAFGEFAELKRGWGTELQTG
jgi:hypothetical protein